MCKLVIAGVRKVGAKGDNGRPILRKLHANEDIWVLTILDAYHKENRVSEVVSGKAEGIDTLGADWAASMGIHVTEFIPDWTKHGKKAGFLRNKDMVDYADKVVCFWDGFSNGTKHTIDLAHKAQKPLAVYPLNYWRWVRREQK